MHDEANEIGRFLDEEAAPPCDDDSSHQEATLVELLEIDRFVAPDQLRWCLIARVPEALVPSWVVTPYAY